ncbi:hypothetical protein CHS0354_018079 [Potamilus streckersoni]|uniref:Gamma-interferon-inducible lysosomal thiol reductase n=1 Tax=Potamilus streckersoni TaxID=2493646 RepID=A0AAE0WES9_9BIVA|nr:hypothetical protein CHS0354_018079 [Potamilus streckersoni]
MSGWVLYCVVFAAAAKSCYAFCQFSPDLWCSSPEISHKCQVSSQCEGWNCLSHVDAKPVDLVIYYESDCEECSDLFENQLDFAYKEVAEIINLQLVPYGTTTEEFDGDTWKFTCKNGLNQCTRNIIQACTIHFAMNISVQFPFIKCIMTSTGSPELVTQTCASKFKGIDWAKIIQCSKERQGIELEHQLALLTEALQPPTDVYPVVTLNGDRVDDIQGKTGAELVKLICQNYQGPLPYGCRNETSNPSHSCHSA